MLLPRLSRVLVLVFVMSVLGALLVFSPSGLVGAQPAASRLLAVPAPARPAIPLPQWGPDARVNPWTGLAGTLRSALQPGAAPRPDRPTAAGERNPSLAIRPTNPNIAVAGYDSLEDGAFYSGYAFSGDAGRSWTGGRFTDPWTAQGLTSSGNVTVGFDAAGTGYYVSQAVSSTVSGYMVLTTTNGTSWGAPHPIVISDYSTFRSEAMMAVDPRATGANAGSLYVAWYTTIYTSPFYVGVQLSYSRDHGQTWSPDVQVSDPGDVDIYHPYPVVADDGTLYIAFEELDDFYIGNHPKLYVNRSTDGGLTWGGDHLITGAPIVPIGGPDWKNHELTLVADANCNLMRINHFPAIAVAPGNSQMLYAVWNDGRWDRSDAPCQRPTQHSDIAFSRSTDGGTTWSAPTRLNDDPLADGVDQFMPSIASYPDGTIGAVWYDRRLDPNNYLYDLYYSQSTDGGLTWSADQRVSDDSSDPSALFDGKGISDIGYRTTLVYGPDYALPGWLDTRDGVRIGNFYVDHGVLDVPSPTATSTSVAPSPTRTVLATATIPVQPSATSAPPSATPSRPPSASPGATHTPAPASHTPTPVGGTPPPSATPCAISFSDVHPTDYFYTPVLYLACHGVVSGYADGTFHPYAQTTRAQLVKIAVLGFQMPIVTPTAGNYTFADLPPGYPFFAFVETAAARNIISGYACGGPGEPCDPQHRPYFRPNADVTRGQLSKIVVNAAGWLPLNPPTPTFADVPAGNAFYGYVERAVAENVLSGYACGGAGEPCPGRYFRPGAPSTRGQLSKILYNVLIQTMADRR